MPKSTITESEPMTGEAFCAPVAPAAHAEPFVLPHDVALAAEGAGMVRTLTLDEQIERAQARRGPRARSCSSTRCRTAR